MKVDIQFCYKDKSLNGKDYIRFFRDFVRFVPYSFSKKFQTNPWDEVRHLKVIENASEKDRIIIIDKNFSVFSVGEAGVYIPFNSVLISQDSDIFFPENEQIEAHIKSASFVSAFVYYGEYVEIQGTKNSENVLHKKFPESVWNTIKDTPSLPGEFGGVDYDIRFNPGRKDLSNYTWLMAAWKMWFGAAFFELIPKARILSFPHAYQIRELEGGQVFVQLHENVEDSVTYEAMRLQQQWRDWCNYGELLQKNRS